MPSSLRSHGLQPTRLLCAWILQAGIVGWGGGVAMLPSRDLPDPGIVPMSLASPALAGRFLITSTAWEAHMSINDTHKTLRRVSGVEYQARSQLVPIMPFKCSLILI